MKPKFYTMNGLVAVEPFVFLNAGTSGSGLSLAPIGGDAVCSTRVVFAPPTSLLRPGVTVQVRLQHAKVVNSDQQTYPGGVSVVLLPMEHVLSYSSRVARATGKKNIQKALRKPRAARKPAVAPQGQPAAQEYAAGPPSAIADVLVPTKASAPTIVKDGAAELASPATWGAGSERCTRCGEPTNISVDSCHWAK